MDKSLHAITGFCCVLGMIFLAESNHSVATSTEMGSTGAKATERTTFAEVRDHRGPGYGSKRNPPAPQGNTTVTPTGGYRPGQKHLPTKVQVAPKGARTDGKVTDHRKANPPGKSK